MPCLKRLLCCSLIVATEVILCSRSITFGQTPDTKPKPTGSISGKVIINGSAAEGIPVVAMGQSNRREAAARAVTDSEGRYRLAELPTGQYQVWAVTPGFIAEPGSLPRYLVAYYGSSQTIILGPNEDVSDIDLKLVRGAVITGRVTDSDNKPVIEEHVSLQPVDENGTPAPFGSSLPSYSGDEMYQTDDRGIYRIYGLPAGRYKVSVGYDASNGVIRGNRRQRAFRAKVLRDARDLKKEIIFKPCEQQANYELPYTTAIAPKP